MNDFWSLFKETEEYPKNVAERGVPQDTLYKYISHTFLNGLINYVDEREAILIERYDIIIFASSENSWWFFWNDRDGLDCFIGRIDKTRISFDEFKELFIKFLDKENYRYFKLPKGGGWITL